MLQCIRRLTVFLVKALVLASLPSIALAHSVYIFAWVDGSQICTESYFTQKNKVRNGEVLMMDATGETLGKGVTAENGLLCFPLPDKAQQLEFVVLAGAGHRGSFSLSESELLSAINTKGELTVVISQENTLQQQDTLSKVIANTTNKHTQTPASVTDNKLQQTDNSEMVLRNIVREELQKQLSPMRQYIAEKLEDKTPGIREIVGGIGWLVGLGAFGFWCSQRRKKQ